MSEYRRQHWVMIFFGVAKQLKEFIVPLLIIFLIALFGGDANGMGTFFYVFSLGAVGLSFIGGILSWIFFRYRYDAHTLEIRSGVFIKKRRTITRARVQTINIQSNIIQRMFGLLSVHIETAGGFSEPELNIKAVPKEEAHYLKQAFYDGVLDNEESDYDGASQFETLFQLDEQTLFLAGLTSGGIGLVFSVIAAVASQLWIFLPETMFTAIRDSFFAATIVTIFFVVAVLVFVSWILSTVRYVLQYGRFTLKISDEKLHITRGFLVQKQLTLARDRIQAIRFVEGLLRQPFGYGSVILEVAGAGGYESNHQTVIHPFIKRDAFQDFIASFASEYHTECNLESVPKRAKKRYLIRASLIFLPLIALGFINSAFWWGFVLWPLSLAFGFLRYKEAASCIDESQMTLRFRLVAKTTVFMKKPHIQSLTITQNPVQRWRKLASVQATVFSAPSSQTFTVKDHELSTALERYAWLPPQARVKTNIS